MKPIRILATSFDYRPALGGVASCAFETLSAMSRIHGVELRLLSRKMPGDVEFDQSAPFETKRVTLPKFSPIAAALASVHVSNHVLLWRPHAVLNFLWLPGGLATFLALPARLITGTPYFTFAHGVEVLESTRTFRKRTRKRLSFVKKSVFNHAAGVFAVSRFTAGLVETHCEVPSTRVHIINNGVNVHDFHPGTPSDDLIAKHDLRGMRIFLTISRLEDYKGIDRAISSLRFVVERYPNVRYLVCGEGPDRKRLESLTRHYRVQKNVIFTGAIPFERRRDYYNLAECLVLLTRSDEEKPNIEGFGLVFLEAAACGKPSIGGMSGGIPDAVVGGETGWLVDPTNDWQIAQTFLECLDQPERAKLLGARARQRAETLLTWDHGAEKILTEIIKNVRD